MEYNPFTFYSDIKIDEKKAKKKVKKATEETVETLEIGNLSYYINLQSCDSLHTFKNYFNIKIMNWFLEIDVGLPKDFFIMVMSSCIILFTVWHVINFPLIWDNKSAEK